MQQTDAANPPVTWVLFNGLWINSDYFQKGIIVVAHGYEAIPGPLCIGDREFYFSSDLNPLKKLTTKYVRKKMDLLQNLVTFSQTKSLTTAPTLTENPVILFNEKRREELFLPLDFSDHRGLYVLPWTSTEELIDFKGFRQFVTAGCLFGGNLKGVTQNGFRCPLVDHHLRLPLGEKIVRIDYDFAELANPFESILFIEFEKTCLLIDAFSELHAPKHLLYHLPTSDYILFGIKLFLNHEISVEALQHFYDLILVKKAEHIQKLGSMAQQHDIIINFVSPFDNLFSVESPGANLEQLLLLLGMSLRLESPGCSVDHEKEVVSRCIHLLQTQNLNRLQQEKWIDFIVLSCKDGEITTIEALFKLANALIIATATHGLANDQTCSILPLSEKQIQVQYDRLRKASRVHHPTIVNLTLFEGVMAYSALNRGLLFYFDCCLESLGRILKTNSLIKQASKNLSFFAQGARDRIVPLQNVILDVSISPQ